MLKGSCAPVTYKSSKLAAALGLKNLYITFNGYYPKIGAHMSTCSFKETEAYSVCGRLGEDHAAHAVDELVVGVRVAGLRLDGNAHQVVAIEDARAPDDRRRATAQRLLDVATHLLIVHVR